MNPQLKNVQTAFDKVEEIAERRKNLEAEQRELQAKIATLTAAVAGGDTKSVNAVAIAKARSESALPAELSAGQRDYDRAICALRDTLPTLSLNRAASKKQIPISYNPLREKEEPMNIRDGVKRLLSYALFGAMFLSVAQMGCQSESTTVAADPATKEVNALLSKPLAKSRKQKVWPDDPLRGFQVFAFNPSVSPGFLDEETFRKFKAWNINVLRLPIGVDPSSPSAVKPGETPPPARADDPMAPYKKNLEGLRIALALAEKYHIYIVPVVGGVVHRETDALGRETNAGDCYPGLIALWEYIARNYGTHPWLLGYDLLNEPNSKDEVDYWHSTMVPQLVKKIRAIDRNTYVVIETAPWALPDQAFPATLKPVKDPKAVYSFHFYYPHSYTHQGIYTYKGPEFEGKPYPGMLRLFGNSAPMFWDKAALEASMKNAIDFQKKYGVKIFVGEFSVIRWAPGAAQWLSDVLDIFEKHHFSWTYHCYGTWNGWNPTFSADAPQSAITDGGVETDRMKLLIKAWANNKKH